MVRQSRLVYIRSGFEAWFDLKYRSSFFLLETLSITSQKFSKCRKNGIGRLRNGNLRRLLSLNQFHFSNFILQCLNTTITSTSLSFPKTTNALGTRRSRSAKRWKTVISQALYHPTKSRGSTTSSQTSRGTRVQRSNCGSVGVTVNLKTFGILWMRNPSDTTLFPGLRGNPGDPTSRRLMRTALVWSLQETDQRGTWKTVTRHTDIFAKPTVSSVFFRYIMHSC